MADLLSVNTVFLMIGDYPLSWIEFVGTLLYFASVYLISRKKMLTWPVGIASVILYGILYYQIQLYSDMMEQAYYLVISVVGWVTWNRKKKDSDGIPSSWGSARAIALGIAVTALATTVLAFCVSRFHLWMPAIFAAPASFPVLDSLTTVMSFVAMYLTTVRKNEGWIYWIVVDVIGIGLYWVKDVRFIAVQYVFLLGMAIYGLVFWMKKDAKK